MTKTRDDAQPLTGTDPNAHNLSVLTATSDSSAQQWGAAYPPQAAYSAYGSYDYSHQMPQSAPQAAAYGAYPSTYPPQVDVKSWRSGSRNEDSHCSHCQVKCFHSSIFIGFSNC